LKSAPRLKLRKKERPAVHDFRNINIYKASTASLASHKREATRSTMDKDLQHGVATM